jgi:hypothetical protein
MRAAHDTQRDIGALGSHDAPDRKRLAALLRASYVEARDRCASEVSPVNLEALAR